MTTPDSPIDGYDRARASRILAELAQPALIATVPDDVLGGPRRITYRSTPLQPRPGSHLTEAQLGYLEAYMQPCHGEQVTSATHRITWADSDGIPNIAHCGPSPLGALVPVAARETVLALWRALAADARLAERAAALDAAARQTLAATTTDGEPSEIFRIGVEATARALIQHAYLAHQTPHADPAAFARAMRDSGLFTVVASTWYWELQASTFRRGMIPVRLESDADGTIRYSADTVAVLRDMKDRTIATARDVMARATGAEGLSVAEAVQRYHHDRDEIAKQYALLPDGEQPRCLGTMQHEIDGRRFSPLPGVADTFVETFVRLLALVTAEAGDADHDAELTDPDERVFHVPDMNCAHCKRTITAVLEGQGLTVAEIDLVSKRVVADFRTVGARERAFDAVRDAGYTVVPPGQRAP